MQRQGQADVVVAGGVETMSDVPIKFSKPLRERMLASRKIKSTSKMLGLLKGLKLKDLAPEVRCANACPYRWGSSPPRDGRV